MEGFSFQEFAGNADKIWQSIKDYAKKVGRAATKVLLELYYVMVDKNTSGTDKFLIGAALAYQVLPTDLLPKSRFGLLGFLDNVTALTYAYNKVKQAITPEIEAKVEEVLFKWFGDVNGDYVEFEEIEQQNKENTL